MVPLSVSIGLQVLAEKFYTAIKVGKLSHAIILSGPKGSGKREMAQEIALALLCQQEDGRSCGVCTSCKTAKNGNHPDIIGIKPSETFYSVKQIQGLIMDMAIKPYYAGKRIFILDQAHLIRQDGWNKMLKTLEEPPESVVMLLLCDSIAAVLETVLSRCQVIKMPRFSYEDIRHELVELGIEADRAVIAAEQANGNISRAVEIAQDQSYWDKHDQYRNLLNRMSKAGGALAVMSNIPDKRNEFLELLNSWQFMIRNALISSSQDETRNTSRQKRYIRMLDTVVDAERRLAANGSVAIIRDWMLLRLEENI